MKKIIGIICTCLIVIVLYLFYSSYYHVEVNTYTVDSEKINHNINIAIISDVHDMHCKIKDKVINQLEELHPDLILCVGDIIDSDSENDKDMIDFLTQLNEISEVYMSIGNHETMYYQTHNQDIKQLETIGIHLLEEDYKDIYINNEQIRIGGMYAFAFGSGNALITKEDMQNNSTYQFLTDMCKTSNFKLMMAHRPDSFTYGDAYKWDLDLIVSGHNHGGQMILPGIGGLYAPEEKWMPKYDYGQYSLGKQTLLLTRGVSSCGKIPRFNNSCEIMQIKLS